MPAKRVLILYYSGSGNTKRMAEAIAEAMRSSSLNVTVGEVGRFDTSLLPTYDSIVIGSPSYFSNIAWQMKKMIDESIMHYYDKKLSKKVAGIFTSAGTRRDGEDCLKMLEIALRVHHGMNVVGSLIRVDGEGDKEVEKRCQEYGKRLAKEIEKGR